MNESVISAITDTVWLRALRVGEGCAARLESPDGNPDRVRIEIARAPTGTPYDVQMNLPRLPIVAGRRYVLTFLARSDRPRRIAVGLADSEAPWANLGLYAEVALTADWQSFDLPVTGQRRQDDARIHFDVGQHDAAVEVAAVAIRDLDEARFVWPRLFEAGPDGSTTPMVPVGRVDFGALRRVTPISADFGGQRGGAVDRHYIDGFLAAHAGDIRGAVLEIGDSTYTRRFGGDRVTSRDVLHVTEGHPGATIIGDLTAAAHIPSSSFDCFILTQTLQFIYDVPAALRTIHRILKPGGVLLATLPSVSKTYDGDWSEPWYWNFTRMSARRLFGEAFGEDAVQLEAYGNVLAAAAFLYGISAAELTAEELSYGDSSYDVTLAIRAVKRPPA